MEGEGACGKKSSSCPEGGEVQGAARSDTDILLR